MSVMKRKERHPLAWIPGLFAFEGIPFSLVTFIAIILLMQTGGFHPDTTVYASLLFLPWALRSFFRSTIRRRGNFRFFLILVETLIFIALITGAQVLRQPRLHEEAVMAVLSVVAVLCAWHKNLSHEFYLHQLGHKEQSLYAQMRTLSGQTSVIVTYGLMLIIVAFLQIYFRDIHFGWAAGCYILAGFCLVLVAFNAVMCSSTFPSHPTSHASLSESFSSEAKHIRHLFGKRQGIFTILLLTLLLMPQSLIFHIRVYFLFAPVKEGGLGMSLFDIGFAQGTVGVLSFTAGLVVGRRLNNRYGWRLMFWWMAVPLGLSPLLYLLMTVYPPTSLLSLSLFTGLNQFLFGYGLNLCTPFIRYLSGHRYRHSYDFLSIPLVASAMMAPMAASGWLVEKMGFQPFFLLCALSALTGWGLAWVTQGQRFSYAFHKN